MTAPTSATSDRRDRHRGFTLIEMTLALAILAMIAALALPRMMPATGSTTLRVTSYEIAALLRSDRNAAARGGAPVVTLVDAAGRRVQSRSSGIAVTIPEDVAVSLDSRVRQGIAFLPDGRSSGGNVVLSRGETVYVVRVAARTGTVDIGAGKPR